MRTTRSTIRRTALITAAVAAAVAPASAMAATGSDAVSANLTGGALSIQAPTTDISFTHLISGTSDPLSLDLGSFSVDDATGAGLGWSLDAGVTALTDAAAGRTLTGAVIQLKQLATATGDGQTTAGPTPVAGTSGPGNAYIDLPTDGTTTKQLASAGADEGLGQWTFPAQTAGLQLVVPADAKTGNYAGQLTLTLTQNGGA